MKPELESAIENRVVRWAKDRGWRVRKMNGLGDRSWPDRLFVGPGVMAFIEFKRKGEEPTELQSDTLETLQRYGHRAGWTDSSDDAIAWLREIQRENSTFRGRNSNGHGKSTSNKVQGK